MKKINLYILYINLILIFLSLISTIHIRIDNNDGDLDNYMVDPVINVYGEDRLRNNKFSKDLEDFKNSEEQISTVTSLVSRKLGDYYLDAFNFQITTNGNSSNFGNNQEYFELSQSDSNNTIIIKANSGVNLASGLYYYLKYYALCQFTWNGDQCKYTNQSIPLPTLNETITINNPSIYRYYFNVCTFGYTTVWWDWSYWEREIDWMALNGYNLPLAFNGQEYIWYSVFKEMGLSDDQVLEWLTGPAFLAWNRMGNVNEWGGKITMQWMEQQRDLQIQILQRMRSYGMQAVLPGFAGHVPPALIQVYPTANITQLGTWCNFNGTWFLDSSDELYGKITKLFIETQDQIYGTDHFYNFDPFNELAPPSNDTNYLRNVSVGMYNHLINADQNAIWVLQGWFLVDDEDFWRPNQTEAFLAGIPQGGLLVLDLWSDVVPAWNITQHFYGHYWIWCMLHNFGGRTGMYGRMPIISTAPIIARQQSPNMVGTGLTPEAIDQNVIVYDLMSEMAWRTTPPNLEQWTNDYVARRYGKPDPNLQMIWNNLVVTVFNCSYNATRANMGAPSSLITSRPQLNLWNNLFYNPSVIVQSWNDYFKVNDSYITSTETFNFDLTEITIQALSNYFLIEYQNLIVAYNSSNIQEYEIISMRMLAIIDYVEMIAASQKMNLLGIWTENARNWSPSNFSNYEFNARNILTLWGPSNSVLHDYANKLWSGLIGDFYYTRWMLFFKYSIDCLQDGMSFNNTYFKETVEFFEETWNTFLNIYPTETTGASTNIARYIQTQIKIPSSGSSGDTSSGSDASNYLNNEPFEEQFNHLVVDHYSYKFDKNHFKNPF